MARNPAFACQPPVVTMRACAGWLPGYRFLCSAPHSALPRSTQELNYSKSPAHSQPEISTKRICRKPSSECSKIIISTYKQLFFTNLFDQIRINTGTARVLSLSRASHTVLLPSLFIKLCMVLCVKKVTDTCWAWKTRKKIFLFWGQWKSTVYFWRHILRKSWPIPAENFKNKTSLRGFCWSLAKVLKIASYKRKLSCLKNCTCCTDSH